MTDIGDFSHEAYGMIRDKYLKEFPEQGNINSSSLIFSLLMAHFVIDVVHNSPALTTNHHGALMELISQQSKTMIDATRKKDAKEPVDWVAGAALLTTE